MLYCGSLTSSHLFRVLFRLPQGNAFQLKSLFFQEEPITEKDDYIYEMIRTKLPHGSLLYSFWKVARDIFLCNVP